MEFGYEPSLDADAELATDRILARMREALARVPLRSAYVDALDVEARPAVQALLFALGTDRAEDVNSLEHHETTAMFALLGRAFAFDGTTPTGAASVVPAILDGFRGEGLLVPGSLDRALGLVFLEGYVRGREERIRADSASRALDSVTLIRVAPKVGVVAVRGAHEPEALLARLESIAREAFAAELEACVVDPGPREPGDAVLAPILDFASLLATVGTEVIVVGRESGRGWVVCDSTESGIGLALSRVGLVVGREPAIPRRLREWMRSRTGRTT